MRKRIVPYDEEERLPIEAVEAGKSVEVSKEEYNEIMAGIPYQTLINSILHRYLNGGIILKDAI